MLNRSRKLRPLFLELIQAIRSQGAQRLNRVQRSGYPEAHSSYHSTCARQLQECEDLSWKLAGRSCRAACSSSPYSAEVDIALGKRSFSASARASAAPAQSVSSKQRAQQQRSPSGHKQRKSYSPEVPPDDSPSRFRPPDNQASLAQLLRSQTSASGGGSQQREVVLTPRGKRLYQQPQNKPAAPWTPTRLLGKRKVYTKRMGFLMQELEKEKEAEAMRQKAYPSFGPGSVLELTLAVPENKNKPAIVKGLCIAKKNRGFRTSFTLLNHLGTYGQVERIFPLYSPSIKAIKVQEHRHVRRAKLYYLRDRNPREYRIN